MVGVAAGARVVPVKVLANSGFGSWGGVLSGVNHVATYGVSGDVVNMSLGGAGSYPILENAIITLASTRKIFFSLAAGNNNINANGFTPARANGINVFTISATDVKCNITSFSNFGKPLYFMGFIISGNELFFSCKIFDGIFICAKFSPTTAAT